MKKRRKNKWIHPKILYICLSVLCVLLVLLSFKFTDRFAGVKAFVGNVVTPMQKGINSVGKYLSDKADLLTSKEILLAENKGLQEKLNDLSYNNKILARENAELDNYRELYKLDKVYPDYPKVAARVISRDGNNWFHVFTIDKGKKDGIQVDMNVIAGNGLVGIVSEVGESYAKVRAIIDDKSNVSAMFQDTGETCIVKGNMESIYKGYIDIEMISNTAKIKDGDEVVTSHVSDKFLQGLSVGYVKDIVSDPSSQTKTAHLIPSVNFDQLENVLVITQLKDNSEIKDIKIMIKKRILPVVMILAAFLLQTTVFQSIKVIGAVPNLLLVLTITYGYLRGRTSGLVVVFSGLLLDCLYGSVVDYMHFIFMTIGFVVGFCKKSILQTA